MILLDTYTEDEFLENLGMFFGIISHHIGDLCTPVHVGHHIDYITLGFKSMNRVHKKIENDIQKLSWLANIKMSRPKLVRLSKKYFWNIAKETYEKHYCRLETLYKKPEIDQIIEMASDTISSGVKHTRDVWHTILTRTKMTKRKWSLQPLL